MASRKFNDDSPAVDYYTRGPTNLIVAVGVIHPGKHSDKVPIKAHSIVLCSRSEYFNTMCNGWSKEAKTKQIPAEESSVMILRMLKLFYMLSYNDKSNEMHE
ncbi:hypothetical protein N7G274_000276 [Stereocaulon virgatum]|uniref:BTB domain-containing protein n=1 Tax=Stereocaulon virgatum TaxID=373712 RepID=A0ABR4ARQ0_9LECA